MNIKFEPLSESDFPLLLKWLESPHVKRWWDPDIVYTMNLVKEKFGKRTHRLIIPNNSNTKIYSYVIIMGKEKIGYIQAYNIHDFAQGSVVLAPNKIIGSVCGVDLFIGELNYLHQGIGPSILNEFSKQVLLQLHFNYCLVDPSVDNKAAIKAFKKAGFTLTRQFQAEQTTWMIKSLSIQSS